MNIKNKNKVVIAFGFFDSIHLGHMRLLERAKQKAETLGVKSAVFTFCNNIYPLFGLKSSQLFSYKERVKKLEEIGIDYIYYVNADNGFLSLPPKEFISVLKNKIDIAAVVCGSDFTFGKGGSGNAKELLSFFDGKDNEIVELMSVNGEKVSSTNIKRFIENGDIQNAKLMLGRDYSISGKVISGRRVGRLIGFPTINIPLDKSYVLPKFGVYISNVVIDGKKYPSITNIGAHPTVGDDTVNAESHIIDFKGDLYGETVTIELLKFIREIHKFDSIDKLVEQLNIDKEARKNYD